MPRLRITAALSVLGLAIGLGGTQWLSDYSDQNERSDARTQQRPVTVPAVGRPTAAHQRRGSRPMARTASAMAPPPAHRVAPGIPAVTAGVTAAAPPELVPIDTPPEHRTPYDKLRGHLDGRVVVHLSIDGDGAVTAAAVAQSSGDAVLDAHALRSVCGWRFALPPDHPAGLSADLPMQFSSRNDPVTSVP